MAREPIAVDLLPSNIAVPTGTTAIGVTGLPGQEGVLIQYLSGGTAAIVQAGLATSATGYSNGFILPATPVYFDLCGTFYLVAAGATALVQVVRTRSSGFQGASFGYNGTN